MKLCEKYPSAPGGPIFHFYLLGHSLSSAPMASFKPSLGIFRCKDYFPIPKNVFYKEEEH